MTLNFVKKNSQKAKRVSFPQFIFRRKAISFAVERRADSQKFSVVHIRMTQRFQTWEIHS